MGIWISSLPTSLTYYFVLILPCLLLTTTHFLDYKLLRPIWISSLPTTLTCVTMISVVNGSLSATITSTTTPTTTITTTAPFQAPISLLTLFSGTPSLPRPSSPPSPTPPPRPSALPTHTLLNHIRTISWTTTTAIFGLLLATLILCDTVCFCDTDTIRRFPYAPRATPLPPSSLLTLLCGRIPVFTTITTTTTTTTAIITTASFGADTTTTTVRLGASFVLFYAFATFCHLHLLFLLFDHHIFCISNNHHQ